MLSGYGESKAASEASMGPSIRKSDGTPWSVIIELMPILPGMPMGRRNQVACRRVGARSRAP